MYQFLSECAEGFGEIILLQQLKKWRKQMPPLIYHDILPTNLTATHTVATIQAFVAGTTADGDMAAGITGRRIALHIFGRGIYCIHARINAGSIGGSCSL